MGLVKRTYTDNVTVITAENLNDIQDEIIRQGEQQAADEAELALKASTADVNAALALKADNVDAFKFRGFLDVLTYTSLATCLDTGVYACGGAYIASLSDLPTDYPANKALLLKVYKYYGVSNRVYRMQELSNSNGELWYRVVDQDQTVIVNWTSVGEAEPQTPQVQTDWNILDSTNVSFIKNKPPVTDDGMVLDWKTLGNSTNPTGFRVGFYATNGGSFNADNKWLGTRTYFTGNFTDYDFMIIQPPVGYRCWVSEQDGSQTFVQTITNGNDDSVNGKPLYVPIVSGHRYAFTFGRFGNGDASTYNTDAFLATFVCKLYRFASRYLTTKKHVNVGSTVQHHFNVTINPTYQKNEWVDAEATANVNAVLVLPSSYRFGGKPTKAIFMHHGQSGTVTDDSWYSEVANWATMYQAYLDAGFAVFDVNGTGAYSASDQVYHRDYGAPNALQAAHKAYEYIVENYNIDPMIFVHGSSMGGATAIAFAKTYPDIVRAVALVSPADLRSSALSDTYKGYIATNYGYADASAMASDGYEELKASAIIPQAYNSSGERQFHTFDYDWLSDSSETYVADFPVPIKIWHGTEDTVTDPMFSEKVIDALRLGGHMAYFRPVSGGTHAICTGGNATVNAELAMWLKRFA